jgi:hypothetical protein
MKHTRSCCCRVRAAVDWIAITGNSIISFPSLRPVRGVTIRNQLARPKVTLVVCSTPRFCSPLREVVRLSRCRRLFFSSRSLLLAPFAKRKARKKVGMKSKTILFLSWLSSRFSARHKTLFECRDSVAEFSMQLQNFVCFRAHSHMRRDDFLHLLADDDECQTSQKYRVSVWRKLSFH